jgi:hypothetical protein
MKTPIFTLLGLIAFSCSNRENIDNTNALKTASKSELNERKLSLLKNPEIIKIDSKIANEIKLKSGSVIHIEPNSFVDEKGNQIQGEVQIEWNEYHSLGDVISSNITMEYDSLGNTYNLVTGGMFSISGSQNEKPIFVAINQKKEMNFYSLDTVKNNWKYITTKSNTTLSDIKSSLNGANSEKTSTILDIQVSVKKFPELQQNEIFGWKTISPINKSIEKIISKREFKSELTNKINDTLYNLKLSNAIDEGTTDFTFAVSPYTYKKARSESFQNQLLIKKNQENIEDYLEKIEDGKVIRSISISKFGTYNWDCIHSKDNPIIVKSDFLFPDNIDPELALVYFICPEDLISIKCYQSESSLVKFDPKKSNFLIAISSKNELLYCKNNQFKSAIPFDGEHFTFEFKSSGIFVENNKNLDEAIEKILI